MKNCPFIDRTVDIGLYVMIGWIRLRMILCPDARQDLGLITHTIEVPLIDQDYGIQTDGGQELFSYLFVIRIQSGRFIHELP
jgi:hypothetical protein